MENDKYEKCKFAHTHRNIYADRPTSKLIQHHCFFFFGQLLAGNAHTIYAWLLNRFNYVVTGSDLLDRMIGICLLFSVCIPFSFHFAVSFLWYFTVIVILILCMCLAFQKFDMSYAIISNRCYDMIIIYTAYDIF